MAEAPKSNPVNLLKLINDNVYTAKVVVPEFQRSFVWARDDIEEFLTSLLHGYFMGTFLMLDTPSNKPMFPFHAFQGVEMVNPKAGLNDHSTVQLVLDGQQRITSLFYAVYEPDIALKGAKNPYRFYLDLDQALNGDLDESVVGVSVKDTKGMTRRNQLCQNHQAVPFSLLRDSAQFHEWLYAKQVVWHGEQRKQINELYSRLEKFMVPVVSLSEETSRGDIVNIFERINRTGVSLSLFDLAVAQLYLNQVNLRALWEDFDKTYKALVSVVKPEFLLRVIALLEGEEINRRALLDAINLESTTFRVRWGQAVEAIVAAYKRITHEYGAFTDKWIPSTVLLVPMAVLLHKLKEKSAGAIDYQKLDRWYWGCVLSRRYDRAPDNKTSQDVRDVGNWIDGGAVPQWLQIFNPDDLKLDVDEPLSALYRGLMGLIVRYGARDFWTGGSAKLNECEDDHIFPRSIYKKDYGDLVDSILNRTLISEPTNKKKGNKPANQFFQECLNKHGGDENKLLFTLKTHFISQEAYHALKKDDFNKFIEERRKTISEVVKSLFLQEIEPDLSIADQTKPSHCSPTVDPDLQFSSEHVENTIAISKNSPIVPNQLNRNDLAKRLGVSPGTISRKRNTKDFTKWTQERDVDSVGWVYSEKTDLYHCWDE